MAENRQKKIRRINIELTNKSSILDDLNRNRPITLLNSTLSWLTFFCLFSAYRYFLFLSSSMISIHSSNIHWGAQTVRWDRKQKKERNAMSTCKKVTGEMHMVYIYRSSTYSLWLLKNGNIRRDDYAKIQGISIFLFPDWYCLFSCDDYMDMEKQWMGGVSYIILNAFFLSD
jgi:hypothetical protein